MEILPSYAIQLSEIIVGIYNLHSKIINNSNHSTVTKSNTKALFNKINVEGFQEPFFKNIVWSKPVKENKISEQTYEKNSAIFSDWRFYIALQKNV